MKKWPLQLRRSVSDGIPANSNGTSLQQQEMSLIQDRNLPSSPIPLYSSPHSKTSGFMKGGLGQPAARKHIMSGHTVIDSSKGLLQWVQSITFVSISMDHSLHLVSQADSSSPGKLPFAFHVFFPFNIWCSSFNFCVHIVEGVLLLSCHLCLQYSL